MLVHLIEGLILGVTLAFIIGPVFFTIIQTSIYRGFRSGVFLSFGVVLSDFTLIVLTYIGLLELLSNQDNQILIGLIGGVLLIIFGIFTLTRKPAVKVKDNNTISKNDKPGPLTYITKGYFMNILNPFLLIFWLTVMSVFTAKEDVDKADIVIFFSATLSTVFITDVIKCYIAKKIKKFITEITLFWINRIVGLILVGFGIFLIAKVFIINDIL